MTVLASAQQPTAMKLWPKGAPGTPTTTEPEKTVDHPIEPGDKRGPVKRITNVTNPTMTVYRPSGVNNGGAVLVFPGGAYRWLALDIEGTEICQLFNREGFTCVLVQYRVPQPDNTSRYEQPLQDAQRAMGIVREHAREWHIDPDRVGVIGFSAGAQLAAVLSNNFRQRTYPTVDGADQLSCRPNFAIIMYPGYLAAVSSDGAVKKDFSVAPEVTPSPETPPTFLFQTEDDYARVENSLSYYQALKNAKVPAEMHIYPQGGHGYGSRGKAVPVAGIWPNLVWKWLEGLKVPPTARR